MPTYKPCNLLPLWYFILRKDCYYNIEFIIDILTTHFLISYFVKVQSLVIIVIIVN